MKDVGSNIKIRFEVDIPVGVTAQVENRSRPRPRLTAGGDIASSDPAANDLKPVRPRTDSALGYLCASITFSVNASDVYAKVYPEANADPHEAPPNSAILGRNTTGTTWVWNDAQTSGDGRPLPGTDHVASPNWVLNTVVFWYKTVGSTDWVIHPIQFRGRTGTTAFCGTGTGGNVVAPEGIALPAPLPYPPFWALEISGLGGPDAVFNDVYALRRNPHALHPTWDNSADPDADAPHVELTHAPALQQWTLAVRLGADGFVTHGRAAEGRLVFQLAKGQVALLGDVPRILATSI